MNARDPLLPLQADEAEQLGKYAERVWDDEIVPALTNYIAVPAKSPMFDAEWSQHGFIDQVVRDAAAWVERQNVAGLKLEVIRLEGRTPVIFFDVPATRPGGNDAGAETICLYGHLDKQPEFNGWKNGFGPWTPRYEGGLLYGRGGADDGYAIYASITAIKSLDLQGIPRPRCVGLIETCEESGSPDLPFYVEALGERLGHIALVVCLDSGAGNYDQLWLTTSLRGNVTGTLKVEILTEGIHSGDASGLVPSSFRILRQVLDRLEDSKTGRLLPESLHCAIPADRIEQAKATAQILGDEVWKRFPWACGADGGPTLPTTTDPVEALLNRTWRPTLSVTGVDGDAGAQGRGQRAAPLHRVQAQPAHAAAGRRRRRRAGAEGAARGQRAVQRQGHLPCRWPHGCGGRDRLERAQPRPLARQPRSTRHRKAHFGAPCGYIGQGGTIPLMNMLQQSFPKAQMMVCGVLGPKSNAHGPNEFLHVPYGKKLTAAVAQVMAACP